MPFKRARFGKYSDLYHYVTNVFTPKDPGTEKAKLVMQMSIVTLEQSPIKRAKKTVKKNAKKKGAK